MSRRKARIDSRIRKTALRRLAELSVVEHDPAVVSAYRRSRFGHGWRDNDGDGQDERAEVLIRFHRKGRGKLEFATDRERRVVSGRWRCRFTDEWFTDAGDLDIDHLVPLKAAWISGASEWTPEKRTAYSNGMGQRSRRRAWLLPVSASANRAKGAKGPDQWMPPRAEYHARYAAIWIMTKHTWKLSVTAAEKAALKKALEV